MHAVQCRKGSGAVRRSALVCARASLFGWCALRSTALVVVLARFLTRSTPRCRTAADPTLIASHPLQHFEITEHLVTKTIFWSFTAFACGLNKEQTFRFLKFSILTHHKWMLKAVSRGSL